MWPSYKQVLLIAAQQPAIGSCHMINSEFYYLHRASLSIPEALGKLNIGDPLPTYVEDQKKRSSRPPQIVEFECIPDQNIV